jgi:hypothetical protein
MRCEIRLNESKLGQKLIMPASNPLAKGHLAYSLLCDDIRLEAGNKLSVMGIFQNIYLQTLPSTILKFALLNHWEGAGEHVTEIKIVSPDRTKLIGSTAPSNFSLTPGGFADNITIFTNVIFSEEGTHVIQIYLDHIMVKEIYFNVVVPPQSNPNVN